MASSGLSKPGPKAKAVWDGVLEHLDTESFYGGVGDGNSARYQKIKISGAQGLIVDQIYANKVLPAATPAEVVRHLQTLGSACVVSKYPDLYLEKLLADHASYTKNLNAANQLKRWAETIEHLRLVGENIVDDDDRKVWVEDCRSAASLMTGRYREEALRLVRRYE